MSQVFPNLRASFIFSRAAWRIGSKGFLNHPAIAFVLSAMVATLDYASGPHIRFPIVYVLPVAWAAWQGRRNVAISLAVTLASLRLCFAFLWGERVDGWTSGVLNAAIHCAMLLLVALLVYNQRKMQAQIRVLRGMLPVCSFCKSIRDESGKWQQMEFYIMDRSEASFTHTCCPACMREHYGDLLDEKQGDRAA